MSDSFQMATLALGTLLLGIAIWRLLTIKMADEEAEFGKGSCLAESTDALTQWRMYRGIVRSLWHGTLHPRQHALSWGLLMAAILLLFVGIKL